MAVITAADLEGRAGDLPVQGIEGGGSRRGHPVLARDEVRYAGQPVAAVLAESRALAEDAAELVEVDYEPLDPVLDARGSDVTMSRWHKVVGDVEGAFELGGARRAREPRTAAARAGADGAARGDRLLRRGDEDLLTVWVSAQDSHRQLAGLAAVLDRPEESIHVIVPDVGGAFGSKARRPPRRCSCRRGDADGPHGQVGRGPRGENFVASYQGRGMEADVELALDADGTMLALRARSGPTSAAT